MCGSGAERTGGQIAAPEIRAGSSRPIGGVAARASACPRVQEMNET
ncbi:hypothetical protein ACWIGW_39095 [Nocardia brasiliensis]